jgi:hypothetical protein
VWKFFIDNGQDMLGYASMEHPGYFQLEWRSKEFRESRKFVFLFHFSEHGMPKECSHFAIKDVPFEPRPDSHSFP